MYNESVKLTGRWDVCAQVLSPQHTLLCFKGNSTMNPPNTKSSNGESTILAAHPTLPHIRGKNGNHNGGGG